MNKDETDAAGITFQSSTIISVSITNYRIVFSVNALNK